jgi:pyridoxamine 5'-phosphate oxidase-like protein
MRAGPVKSRLDRSTSTEKRRVPQHEELRTIARTIIDGNRYMTLGTADESGVPWVSPVWYAPAGYRELIWVSSPEARHSRNVATRPQVGTRIARASAACKTKSPA